MCGCKKKVKKTDLERCQEIGNLWTIAGLGTVRHLGGNKFHWFLTWYGLPQPIVAAWPFARWLVAANISATGDPLEVRELPRRINFNVGCGCIAFLKDGVKWLSRLV